METNEGGGSRDEKEKVRRGMTYEAGRTALCARIIFF
jgi:hypothetical protein